MNTFLAIVCFALVATATAKPGYNYQQPKVQVAPAPQYAAPAPQYVAPAPQYAAPAPVQQQQFVAPAPQYAAPVQQFSAPSNQYLAPVQQQQQQQQFFTGLAPVSQYQPSVNQNYQPQQQTIISKDIFIHSAPEETEELGNDQGVESGPLRKNYRIVFIKAPAQNLKLNLDSLKRAQASNEEKTVIYVLSKKPDLGNLQSQLSAVQNEQKAHKPEVYFIKYKTQEEANRAQQEIQAQYDSLGGSTHISDEGIAPVTSVIGGGRVNVGSVGPSFSSGSVGPSFSAGGSGGSSFNGGNNFVQNGGQQQQFAQQSFQSSQGSSGSAVNFGGSAAPSQKYLPAQKK